jgi:hypothetical protein
VDDTEPRNPFTTRGFILGAIIVGLLIVGAIIVSVLPRGEDLGAASSPTATAAPTPTADATPEGGSICDLPGIDASGTLSTPPAAEWTIVGTMAAPSTTTTGPGVVDDDGVRSCYAHTIEGALYAVANAWAMGSDARLAPLAIAANTVPGPGRDAAMAADTSRGSGGVSAQIAGFKILNYTDNEATVDIAFQLTNGTLTSFAATVAWSDGDWKGVLTDDGQPLFRPVLLQSLGGYTPWSGL